MPEATQVGAGKRVLVVDDEDMPRQTITRMLEAGGFSVVTAASGAEAIELLARNGDTIDIVLSDVQMPGMNGIDLSYHIREQFPSMPVAIVSGDVSDLERSIIGRSDVPFIKKPFHAESLYSAVREAIRQHPES
jgi:two-component system cell cycle sensor histidine kinase/response regulator CckA